MSLPLSYYHRNIEINITDNRHFALFHLLGITRPPFTQSMAQESPIHAPTCTIMIGWILPIYTTSTYWIKSSKKQFKIKIFKIKKLIGIPTPNKGLFQFDGKNKFLLPLWHNNVQKWWQNVGCPKRVKGPKWGNIT